MPNQPLTLKALQGILTDGTVAIRGLATLEPAGGPGDKVFPPSHLLENGDVSPGAKYAFEKRRLQGVDVDCVLMDSVQSQANRMEEVLQKLWTAGRISLPVVVADFTDAAPDVGIITSLSAPHRIADAILRDSLLDGKLFRLSDIGRAFTGSSPRNAIPMFQVCPTALVFGLWDSTGLKGSSGTKFARTITSEIVGIGATRGVKTASRIDPLGIEKEGQDIFEASDPSEDWTPDPSQAKKDPKGKLIKFKNGAPSGLNHGNHPPLIDQTGGGVTIDHATQTVVISIAALRKLSFGAHDDSARTVLAALAILAIVAAENEGHDLRSRCLLVPKQDGALTFEAVQKDGQRHQIFITFEGALALYNDACAALPSEMRFNKKPGEPLAILKPSMKLTHLIKKSRELSATTVAGEAE